MQQKSLRPPKKVNPHAQAPGLFEKCKALGWTQNDLRRVIPRITQQAISDYSLGYVWKERFDVIEKLREIVARKLPPPPELPEEVWHEHETGSAVGATHKRRKKKAEAGHSGNLQARRTKSS